MSPTKRCCHVIAEPPLCHTLLMKSTAPVANLQGYKYKNNTLPTVFDFGVHHFRVTVSMYNPSFDGITNPSEWPVMQHQGSKWSFWKKPEKCVSLLAGHDHHAQRTQKRGRGVWGCLRLLVRSRLLKSRAVVGARDQGAKAYAGADS